MPVYDIGVHTMTANRMASKVTQTTTRVIALAITSYIAFGLVQAQAQTPSIQSITDNNVQVVLEEEQYEVGPVSCARK